VSTTPLPQLHIPVEQIIASVFDNFNDPSFVIFLITLIGVSAVGGILAALKLHQN
jgi:hypothetical protein